MATPLAHSGGHGLAAHLQAVANRAGDFSNDFDKAELTQRWAYLAGLWHDLGKYRPGFQRYPAARWFPHVGSIASGTGCTPVRTDVLRQCRNKAALPEGLFLLTVPIGRSFAFFALHILRECV